MIRQTHGLPIPRYRLWPSTPSRKVEKLEQELPIELADRLWVFVYGRSLHHMHI